MGKLTHRKIEAAKATGKDYTLVDGGGLYLRVSRAGSRSWVYRYRPPDTKQRVWLSLGPFNAGRMEEDSVGLTLSQARAKASGIAAARRAEGVDPRRAQEARKAARRSTEALAKIEGVTVGAVFTSFEERQLSRRKDQGAAARRVYEKDIAPDLADVPIRAVTRAQIVAVLDKIVSRGSPVQANRTLSLIGQLFKFALMRELIVADPTRLIERKDVGGREAERVRALSEEEIRDLAERLSISTLPVRTKHCVWILLATLARVGELSAARWSEVDLDASVWTIPESTSKNGYRHEVQLSAFAVGHFKALRALEPSDVWLLPARRQEGTDEHPIDRQSIAKALADRQWQPETGKEPLRGRLKLSGELLLAGGQWRPHDLRRTGATLMGELGVMPNVIERCLNHRERSKVERTYQRQLLITEQREAWKHLGERLDSLCNLASQNAHHMRQFERQTRTVFLA